MLKYIYIYCLFVDRCSMILPQFGICYYMFLFCGLELCIRAPTSISANQRMRLRNSGQSPEKVKQCLNWVLRVVSE